MTNSSIVSRIPHSVEVIDEETTSVTFVLPSCAAKGFIMMFMSFADLFRSVDWKQRMHPRGIQLRNEKKKPEIEEMAQRYENAVITTFKTYCDNGNTPRESLSLTVSKVHEHFPFSSYDMVKTCLSKNKMLKKTGFYKSRHKFDEK